jgi:hypothetical protein
MLLHLEVIPDKLARRWYCWESKKALESDEEKRIQIFQRRSTKLFEGQIDGYVMTKQLSAPFVALANLYPLQLKSMLLG